MCAYGSVIGNPSGRRGYFDFNDDMIRLVLALLAGFFG